MLFRRMINMTNIVECKRLWEQGNKPANETWDKKRREISVGVSIWRNLHAGQTVDKAGFRLRVNSHLYWLFELRGICSRWAIENSVSEFSTVPNNWVLSVIWLRLGNHYFDLQFNFDSTRFRSCKGCAYHFLFHACILWYSNPSAHKWYQIRKWLADCAPLSRSATVINIRVLLKAASYFSPSRHYVWIFTSQ